MHKYIIFSLAFGLGSIAYGQSTERTTTPSATLVAPAKSAHTSPMPESPEPHPDHEFSFKRGIEYEYHPANFKLQTRFRMQTRFTYEDYDETDPKNIDTADFAVRRMRLRFEGHVLDPRLLYKIQLAFTRGDMDYDTNNYPNILRDAVVGWKLTDKGTIWFGQTKLPGNRQRVISSGSQELVDRSLLNATFNIDRDMGLQYYQQFGEARPFWVKVAVSNGEGRANNNHGLGLSYTGRLEWLPLGNFKDGGDYYEGDLAFEETPKISMGAVYNYNKHTSRVGGQIGKELLDGTTKEYRDLHTTLADLLLKYRGWAWSTEFAHRRTDNPVISSSQSVYAGKGVTSQLSYVFPNQLSPVVRYTRLWADQEILEVENDRIQYTLGLTRYFNNHNVKLMGDITYEEVENSLKVFQRENWIYRVQLEVGI